jgi:hypothetical protein
VPQWSQLQPATQPSDPYFEWANETQFAYLFAGRRQMPPEERWFPVILELGERSNVRQFARREWHHPLQSSPLIEIPEFYANLGDWAAKARYCTAMVRKAFIDAFHDDKALRSVINRVETGLPLKSDHKPNSWKGARKKAAKPGTVVTGIIDDGLAFANERFRLKLAKARIEYLWNQDGLPTAPPSGYFDGWEIAKDTVPGIDDLLRACTHAGIVDEDEVYARAHHIDYTRSIHKPVALRGAHGTHVMDIAAGHPLAGAPDDRPIVAVQLPVATTADTSGASLAKYALEALYYILERADSLAPAQLPVVVNLSYGMIAGPHNGTSILEAGIEQIIGLRSAYDCDAPLSVVLPAGNSHLARCHAQFALTGPGREQSLSWKVMPDDTTPSFMEVWMPDLGANTPSCEVMVTTPTGAVTPQPIKPGEEWVWKDGNEVLCKVLYLTTLAPGRTRPMIFIALAPTFSVDGARKVAPSGTWTVKLKKKNSGSATVDAWIQRDDTPYGYPRRGRQSRFDDDEQNYPYWDSMGREEEDDSAASYIQRKGSVNAIATGQSPIVMGAFTRKYWRPAKYSAGGPVIHPPGRGAPKDDGPDAVAVSDDSPAHLGILASGTRSGSKVPMNGTSVAAPQITRWAAERMAAGGWQNRHSVDKFVRLGIPPSPWVGTMTEANRPPNALPPNQLPELRIGSGRVEFPAGVFPSIVDRKIER